MRQIFRLEADGASVNVQEIYMVTLPEIEVPISFEEKNYVHTAKRVEVQYIHDM